MHCICNIYVGREQTKHQFKLCMNKEYRKWCDFNCMFSECVLTYGSMIEKFRHERKH